MIESGLLITEQDYKFPNSLTDEAKEKIFTYIENYFESHRDFNMLAMSREVGVNDVTMSNYVKKYFERVRKNLLEQDDTITIIQKRLYDALWDVRTNSERYKFVDEKERIRFETELVDKILGYKKLENPVEDLQSAKDTANAAALIGVMGSRMADYLLNKLNEKKIIQPDADNTTE
jgi:hypothetical protein